MTEPDPQPFAALPQHPEETWEADLVEAPFVIGDENASSAVRPWWPLVCSDTGGPIPPTELVLPDQAHPQLLWDALRSMAEEQAEPPHRPGRVVFRRPEDVERFGPALHEAGIEVARDDELPHIDGLIQRFAEDNGSLGKFDVPPIFAEREELTDEAIRGFAEAAHRFFESRPWRHLSDVDRIDIEAPAAPKGMACAVVLGAAAIEHGLHFVGDPERLWTTYQANDSQAAIDALDGPLWALLGARAEGMAAADVALWQEQGLPLADAASFPRFLGFDPEAGPVPPEPERLAFLEAILRALAATTEQQIDSGRFSVDVETSHGPETVTLALPDLLEPPTHQEWMRRGLDPDRRAMERLHAQMDRFLAEHGEVESQEQLQELIQAEFMGQPVDPDRHPPRNALEKAQDLCFDAFDAHGRRRVQLAREALATHEDCADAYVILAEHHRETDPEAAETLYEQGMRAGERALGPERFETSAGSFWGETDTRPYMRARFGLAEMLADSRRAEEAIEHYRALLELNPQDNQGVRYLLLSNLLDSERDEEAARLLREQDEATTFWQSARALVAYRLGGDSSQARRELQRAVKANPHLPRVLEEDPDGLERTGSYSPGDRSEAAFVVDELWDAIVETEGALDWFIAQGRALGRRGQESQKRWKKRKKKSR